MDMNGRQSKMVRAILSLGFCVVMILGCTGSQKEKEIKDALYRQLFNPVRWQETVQLIASQGANAFVELGPGKVLTGLSKRIERKVPCYCVHDVKSLEQALEQLESLVHDVVE